MEKLDLTKEYKSYYTAKNEPEIIFIDPVQYISICGKGDPNGKPFEEHIEALYPTAYALKFMYKAKGKDFVVAKLEALWWFDQQENKEVDMVSTPGTVPRSEWEYRLLIRLPDFVVKSDLDLARNETYKKKGAELINQVEYFQMSEGKCVQMMHIGPFTTEPESLQKILDFCDENKLAKNGKHHEIYLSDFRKTEPEKLKTILREPVK